ncbi:MAG: ATP-binding protein [Pseudomonadales bacterium]
MFLDRRLTKRKEDLPDDHVQERNTDYASAHCWFLEFSFRNAELCEANPVPGILDALIGSGLPESARADVHTVINELYVNALDYGVLAMSDSQKQEEDSFYEFHECRDQKLCRLAELGDTAQTWIKIDCMLDIADRPRLEIVVADSGPGMTDASDEQKSAQLGSEKLTGRGLHIVRSLASELQFYGQKNQIKVVYQC